MKDIYRNMNTQNILGFYGYKLNLTIDSSELYDFKLVTDELCDLVLDNSEFYDFILEKPETIELKLDYSEFYDFELVDDSFIYVNPDLTSNTIINEKLGTSILTQDGYSIITQNSERIEYQY